MGEIYMFIHLIYLFLWLYNGWKYNYWLFGQGSEITDLILCLEVVDLFGFKEVHTRWKDWQSKLNWWKTKLLKFQLPDDTNLWYYSKHYSNVGLAEDFG